MFSGFQCLFSDEIDIEYEAFEELVRFLSGLRYSDSHC